MNPLTFKEDGSNFVFDTLKFTFLQIQISLSRKEESFMGAILPKHDLLLPKVVQSALWSILLLFYPHFIVFIVNDDKNCWKKNTLYLLRFSVSCYTFSHLIPSCTKRFSTCCTISQDLCHENKSSYVNVAVWNNNERNVNSCNWSII